MIPSIIPTYETKHLKDTFSKFVSGKLNYKTIIEFEKKFAEKVERHGR